MSVVSSSQILARTLWSGKLTSAFHRRGRRNPDYFGVFLTSNVIQCYSGIHCFLFLMPQSSVSLISVAEAAKRLNKGLRWMYRHLDDFETSYPNIEKILVHWNETDGEPVKKK